MIGTIYIVISVIVRFDWKREWVEGRSMQSWMYYVRGFFYYFIYLGSQYLTIDYINISSSVCRIFNFNNILTVLSYKYKLQGKCDTLMFVC